jgi:hypothetical protein
VLTFNNESDLVSVGISHWEARICYRSFLQMSSRSLSVIRLNMEFGDSEYYEVE